MILEVPFCVEARTAVIRARVCLLTLVDLDVDLKILAFNERFIAAREGASVSLGASVKIFV